MRAAILATTVLVAACAPPTAAPEAAGPEAAGPEAASGLRAGADLPTDLPAPVAETTAPRAPAVPLDLGADRAVVKLDVPRPPAGGAVPFDTPDGRRGFVTRIPEGLPLPALAYGDGRVYASGGFNSTSFYAVSAQSGTIEWQTRQLEDNGPTAAVYDDGRVIFNTESCTLFVLDAGTGKRKWLKYLGDPTLAQVALGGGLIYAAHPSPDGYRLSAFRVESGARAWSRRIDQELLAAPVVHGDSVYVATLGGFSHRFTGAGKQVWRAKLDATTAPWIDGDRLYTSRRERGGEAQVVVATATGRILETHHVAPGSHLRDVPRDLSSWPKVWEFEGSRPVVADGVRYVAMGGELTASDARSGEARWIRRDAAGAEGRRLGTVALAGPEVVVASRAGRLFGLDIDTGYTLWSYDVGLEIAAEPIVARGWVYAATRDGHIVGLEVADQAVDGWHMFGGSPGHNGPVTPAPSGQKRAGAADPAPVLVAERPGE